MMRLNLTSPEMQQTIRQYVYVGVARTLAVTLMGFAVLFLGVHAIGNSVVHSRAANLTQEADRSNLLLRGQKQATLTDTTKRLNAQVQVLKNMQKKYVAWMPILQKFSSLTPAGISLTSLTFTQQPAEVSIVGTADSRDHYIAYESVLQASPLVKNVQFPLQTKKTAVEFNVKFDLVLP